MRRGDGCAVVFVFYVYGGVQVRASRDPSLPLAGAAREEGRWEDSPG